MVEDHILETYIYNPSTRAPHVIEQHLQEERFLRIECTITLEDIALQLSLQVDGSIIMGLAIVGGWSGICEQLLGKVPERFFSSRIEIKWLEQNLNYLDNYMSDLEREQYD
ncbi:hypothetical protein J1N35_001293 [Gossypium stocksii]|uniref:Uncharacterized protein n=1 Tax=Gossypium stocksii TaxID=47602 RepID=A0A9D4AJH1_9ROSI|nr:hypothetical protein J1N35_001293 [Gossypium stocksii]